MENLKQHLIEEITNNITAKEQEIQELDHELGMLNAKVKVENKTLGMQDLKEHLREDFKYSAQVLEGMLAQEQNRNSELKKDLEMLEYRKAVLESQFSDNDLDRQ